jgi:tetratricopeptide (TPR) repeat protein
MTPTEELLDLVDPDEIDERIAAYRQSIDLKNQVYSTTDDFNRIFDYIRHLIYVREFEDAARVLHEARSHLEKAVEHNSNDLKFLNLWIDWNELAMRFVLPEPDQFAEYPFFKEIESVCLQHGDQLRLRLLHNKLALLIHLENWKSMGFEINMLPTEQLNGVTELIEKAISEINEHLKSWKLQSAYVELISLKRALLRYYSFTNQPKLAIEILKEMLEELPHHPQFNPTDLADINLEIGSIYFNYNKFKVAIPYLEAARDIYEAAGEEFEVHASQSDALVKECEEQLSYL